MHISDEELDSVIESVTKHVDYDSLEEKGHAFGYPECCIASFVKESNDILLLMTRTERQFTGTGFVPCVECSANKTREELIDEINSQRAPEHGLFEESDSFLTLAESNDLVELSLDNPLNCALMEAATLRLKKEKNV